MDDHCKSVSLLAVLDQKGLLARCLYGPMFFASDQFADQFGVRYQEFRHSRVTGFDIQPRVKLALLRLESCVTVNLP